MDGINATTRAVAQEVESLCWIARLPQYSKMDVQHRTLQTSLQDEQHVRAASIRFLRRPAWKNKTYSASGYNAWSSPQVNAKPASGTGGTP